MNTSAISAGTILLAMIGAWLAHRLAKARDRDKLIDEAKAKLHSAFAETIATLVRGDEDPFRVLSIAKEQHDTAVLTFRPFLPRYRIAAYDAAIRRFHEVRHSLMPGLLTFYERDASGQTSPAIPATPILSAISTILTTAGLPEANYESIIQTSTTSVPATVNIPLSRLRASFLAARSSNELQQCKVEVDTYVRTNPNALEAQMLRGAIDAAIDWEERSRQQLHPNTVGGLSLTVEAAVCRFT